jgi:hypothetical protein
LIPNARALGLIALHDSQHVISLFALQVRNHCYLPTISLVNLEKILQVLFGGRQKKHVGRLFFFICNFDPLSFENK